MMQRDFDASAAPQNYWGYKPLMQGKREEPTSVSFLIVSNMEDVYRAIGTVLKEALYYTSMRVEE